MGDAGIFLTSFFCAAEPSTIASMSCDVSSTLLSAYVIGVTACAGTRGSSLWADGELVVEADEEQ